MEVSPETIVARRPVALAVFLVLAFGLSWLALLPVIVDAVSPTSTAGKVFLPLVAIGSPGIAAFVVAGLFAGRAGVSACCVRVAVGGCGSAGMRSSCCCRSSRTAWRSPRSSLGPVTFRHSTCP